MLRLLAEHEAMSTEQLAVFCFRPDRPADAVYRLRYLATRALLVQGSVNDTLRAAQRGAPIAVPPELAIVAALVVAVLLVARISAALSSSRSGGDVVVEGGAAH